MPSARPQPPIDTSALYAADDAAANEEALDLQETRAQLELIAERLADLVRSVAWMSPDVVIELDRSIDAVRGTKAARPASLSVARSDAEAAGLLRDAVQRTLKALTASKPAAQAAPVAKPNAKAGPKKR